MAKIKGGLFSISARGSIADLITFQGRKHFEHVHKKPTPKNPQTTTQTANRTKFKETVATWHLLTSEEKQAYNIIGHKFGNIPGFNAFIKLSFGTTTYWTRYSEDKFGANKKFGGPLGSQTT